jgi:hypothetical protein
MLSAWKAAARKRKNAYDWFLASQGTTVSVRIH